MPGRADHQDERAALPQPVGEAPVHPADGPALDAAPGTDAAGDYLADLGDVIGGRLRDARSAAELTISELAERAEISKAMLSKIENARSLPSLASLARLAQSLELPMAYFVQGADDHQNALLVRSGQGTKLTREPSANGVEHSLLGRLAGRAGRVEPVLVTVSEEPDELPLYQHDGSELLYVLYGALEYACGERRFVLEAGDTLQFEGQAVHGTAQVLQLPVQFLSIRADDASPN